MPKCGYIVHKTMPEFLSRQYEMDQSQQDAAHRAIPLTLLPKISTHYKRLISPPRLSFWYIRAWVYLKQKLSKN